jgi:hypothetical protein
VIFNALMDGLEVGGWNLEAWGYSSFQFRLWAIGVEPSGGSG